MRFQRSVVASSMVVAMTAGGGLLAPLTANAAAGLPTLTVTMTAKTITTSSGTTVHAGRTQIKVIATDGEHDLQLVKLARGYSLTSATKDFMSLFNGDVATVRRVDKNIRFFGGATAVPGQPGLFAETLYAGTYMLVDTNGRAHNVLHVLGRPPARAWVAQSSTIVGNGQDRFVMPASIPHSGWTLFRDTSDEPHFLVVQQVKPGTTAAQVGAFLAGGSQDAPPFALPASTSSGVISGGTQVLWHYSLPKGSYVVLCFWPSDEDGMPHANMGMYKLVTLR